MKTSGREVRDFIKRDLLAFSPRILPFVAISVVFFALGAAAGEFVKIASAIFLFFAMATFHDGVLSYLEGYLHLARLAFLLCIVFCVACLLVTRGLL